MACGAYFPIGHYESPEAATERELHEYVADDRTQRIRNMIDVRDQQSAQILEVRRARALLEELKRQQETARDEHLCAQAAAGKQQRQQFVNDERERKRKAYVENRMRAIRTSTTHYRAFEQPENNTRTLHMSQNERLNHAHDFETIWQHVRNPHDLNCWLREKSLADEKHERNLTYGQKLLRQAVDDRSLREQQRVQQLREEQISNEKTTAAIKQYELDCALAKRIAAESAARDIAESLQAQRCKRERERGHICARERKTALTKLLNKRFQRERADTSNDNFTDDADPLKAERTQQVTVDEQHADSGQHAQKFSTGDRLRKIQQSWAGSDGVVKQPWLQHYHHTYNKRQKVHGLQKTEMHGQQTAEFLQRGNVR